MCEAGGWGEGGIYFCQKKKNLVMIILVMVLLNLVIWGHQAVSVNE